jgi:DNA polymerase III delta prime subunit
MILKPIYIKYKVRQKQPFKKLLYNSFMHAYLVVGRNKNKKDKEVQKLLKKHKSKAIEYSLESIGSVRDLARFTKLSLSEKTAILVKEIDNASHPALNAFLKNLEEPQENLIYILTASTVHSVLPTIASRCQLIKVAEEKSDRATIMLSKNFIESGVGERLIAIDKIRSRDAAIDFINSFIEGLHQIIVSENDNYKKLAKSAEITQDTLEALKENGNVTLQLTHFAINI